MQFSRACKNEHKYKRRLFCAGKSYSRITNSYEAETLWNSNNSEQIKKKDFELKGSHRLAKRSSIIQSLFVQLGRGLLTNPAVDITTGLQNKKKQKKKKAREKVNCSLLKAVNLQPWLPIFSSYINGLMGDEERLEPDIFKICQELAFQKGSQNLNLALVLQVISTNVPI